MTVITFRRLVVTGLCVAAALGISSISNPVLMAYAVFGYKWNTTEVPYYINPQSVRLSASAASAALQAAASAWTDQTDANVHLMYGGNTSGSSLTLNYKNEVFFRNDSGSVAVTYWYADYSGRMLDADIIFYEGNHQFVTDGMPCSGGVSVQDAAAHEFGHLLGLNHSADTSATMYAVMSAYCETSWRTLAADDISGVESLYPPAGNVPAAPSQVAAGASGSSPTSALAVNWSDNASNESGFRIERSTDGVTFAQIAQVGVNSTSYINSGLASGTTYHYRVRAYNSNGNSAFSNVASASTQAASNTSPVVSIANPLNSSLIASTSAVSFVGSASDVQDGNLTSSMRWSSSIDGSLGTGSGFSRMLNGGTHLIKATVTDSAGSTASQQVTITVTVDGPTLSARPYKVKGAAKVDLSWVGISTGTVDIYRDGRRIVTTANDSFETDNINRKGGGSYSYKVCESGSATCSNAVTVSF